MERSLETQVNQAVEAWLRWVPRWEPASHRARQSVCRRCLGSPILAAAGLGDDIPHGVKHGISTRMKTIIDHAVAEYTARNLPLLQGELDQQAARNRARAYRPGDDLAPEFDGMPLDPDPVPGAPFLFTLAGMAEEDPEPVDDLPPLSEEAKVALRRELALADDFANMVGREVCGLLVPNRGRVHEAVTRFVEPQIDAMLADLARSLDDPFGPPPAERG